LEIFSGRFPRIIFFYGENVKVFLEKEAEAAVDVVLIFKSNL